MIPSAAEVARVMEETGMGRMQAIRHLQSRATVADRLRRLGRYSGVVALNEHDRFCRCRACKPSLVPVDRDVTGWRAGVVRLALFLKEHSA